MSARRHDANRLAFQRLTEAEPVLIDVQRAVDVIPGMTPNMVLTSGPQLTWEQYTGPHRRSILNGALFEGLARTVEEADGKIKSGEIVVAATHDHGVSGAHAGIHTASMLVFVVEDKKSGRRGFSSFFEGDAPRRLSQGSYDPEVVAQQRFVDEIVAPTIGEAVRRLGGIALPPIIRRAIHFGDDLHMRTVASTMLFTRALLPAFLDMLAERPSEVRRTLAFLETAEHSFFRVELAMAKALTDAAGGIEGSSLVTRMAISCTGFNIQVSGLGDLWVNTPEFPAFEGKLFDANERLEDCLLYGTDSVMVECVGFGSCASAAAFAMQSKMGGTARMIERNLDMYRITLGEHPEYKIPYLDFRGVPIGFDIFKVVETGVTPYINGAIANRVGSFAGLGILRTPIEVFRAAVDAYRERYGDPS